MDFHTLRNVAIVGLIQVGVIVAGVLFAGVYQKWVATFHSPGRSATANFLADHGGWLLLIPVLWTAFAVAAMRGANSDRTHWLAFASGFVVAGVLLLVVIVGVANPWGRLFHW